MKNPLFKAGIKAGTHRLNDPGVERRIKIKNIRSPQMTVDEKKVKALSRFTKNMPGTPTVSHAGHGKWTLKDGNHRVAAAMKQGKRVITVKTQRMSAKAPIIRFDDQLQPHQARVRRRILDPNQPGLVVAHGLGSGKTRTAIEAHKALGGDADVVVPAALQGNYAKELARWGGDPAKSKIQSHQKAAMGREPLSSNLLITDEGHRARNAKTGLSQAIKGSASKKRLILTGTPIYNNPSDIATLVNQAAGKPVLREGKAFENRYTRPNFLSRWRGNRLSHEGELKKVLNKYVDYHKGDPSMLPSVTSKTIPVEMTKHQSALYRASMGGIPKGLKVDQKNIDRLKPYLTGPRQVSNTARALDPDSHDEPKIDRAFADLQKHLENPKGKALVYSNWLEHGIKPLQQRLTAAKIPHGVFTGNEPMKQRNQTVKDYNDGKHRALLVSSSGAEGLDLKGTRMVQVLEPHFNNAKIRQVVGRSARMGSHAALNAEDRNVEVRSYVGRPKNRFFPGHSKGVEDLLNDSSRDKDEVARQITRLLSSKMKPIQFSLKQKIKAAATIGGMTALGTVSGAAWGTVAGGIAGSGDMKKLRDRLQNEPGIDSKKFAKKHGVRIITDVHDVNEKDHTFWQTAALRGAAMQAQAGKNAFAYYPKKGEPLIIANKRAPKDVLAHEIGHITDQRKNGRIPAWQQSPIGTATGHQLAREEAAWKESGLPPDENALNTYRKGKIGARIGAVAGTALGIHVGLKRARKIKFIAIEPPKMKTIRFDRPKETRTAATQKRAASLLRGSAWEIDPELRAVRKAVINKADPVYSTGGKKESRVKDIGGRQYVEDNGVLRGGGKVGSPHLASDWRDTEGFRKAVAPKIQRDIDTLQGTSPKATKSRSIPEREKIQSEGIQKLKNRLTMPADKIRTEAMIPVREELAREVSTRKEIKRVYGKKYGAAKVPSKVINQASENLTKLIPAREEKFKAASDKLGQKLFDKVRTHVATTEGAHQGWDESKINTRTAEIMQPITNRPAPKGFGKRMRQGSLFDEVPTHAQQATAESKEKLAGILGRRVEDVDRLRENLHGLKNTGSEQTQRKIKRSLIGSGEVFKTIPDKPPEMPSFRTDLKTYPRLKKIGIGAGILGAGYLATKLLKKKDEPQKQLMASRLRLIRFGWKSNPYVDKLLAKKTTSTMAYARTELAHLMKNERKSAPRISNPSMDRHERLAAQRAAERPYEFPKTGGPAPFDPNHGKAMAVSSDYASNVERGTRSHLYAKEDVKYPEAIVQADVEKLAASKVRKETKKLDKAAATKDALHEKQMNEVKIARESERAETKKKVAGIQSGVRRKIAIGVGSGLIVGGVGGYASRRPEYATEFSAKMSAFTGRPSGYIKSELLGNKGPGVIDTLLNKFKGMSTGGKIGYVAGATIPLPFSGSAAALTGHYAEKAVKSRPLWIGRGDNLGAGLKKLTRQQPRGLTFINHSAKGDTLRFEVTPLQQLRNKINPPKEDKLHDVLTGGVEGSVGSLPFLAVEHRILKGGWKNPLLNDAGQFVKGDLAKRLAVGGVIGAAATGLIGAGISAASRKRKESAPVQFASLIKKDENGKNQYTKDITRADEITAAGITGGAGAYAIHQAIPMLAGTQRVYHGTDKESAAAIRKSGLDPSHGGREGGGGHSEGSEYFQNASKGKIHVAADRFQAGEYAGVTGAKSSGLHHRFHGAITGGKGKILSAHIPYQDFLDDFSIDRTTPVSGAYHSSKPLPASAFRASAILKAPKISYIKKNPMRLVKGAGLLVAGAGSIEASRRLGVFATRKNRKDWHAMSSKLDAILFAIPSRGAVTQDRYRKQIHETDMDRAEGSYLRTGAGGAAIGSLLAKKGGRGKAALIGTGAGLVAHGLTRAYTAGTKDQFGDRPYSSKQIDRVPSILATTGAVGLAGKAGYDKLKAARVIASKWGKRATGAGMAGLGLYAASKLFSSRQRVIHFGRGDQLLKAMPNMTIPQMAGESLEAVIRKQPHLLAKHVPREEWGEILPAIMEERKKIAPFARGLKNNRHTMRRIDKLQAVVDKLGKMEFAAGYSGAKYGIDPETGHYVAIAEKKKGIGAHFNRNIGTYTLGGLGLAGTMASGHGIPFLAGGLAGVGVDKFREGRALKKFVRQDGGRQLSSHRPIIQFDYLDKWIGGTNKSGGEIKVNYGRRVEDITRTGKRISGALSDIGGRLKGQPALDARGRPRKEEWDKPYAKKLLATAILGGGLLAANKIRKMPPGFGKGTAMRKIQEQVRAGVPQKIVRAKFPKTASAYDSVMNKARGEKQGLADEFASATAGHDKSILGRISGWMESEHKKIGGAATSVAPAAKPVNISVMPGAASEKDIAKKIKEAQKTQTSEETAKKADDLKKKLFSAREELDNIIRFGEDTVYDDKWEHWVRNRPGVIKRNRDPKPWRKRSENQPLINAGIFAGTAIGTMYAARKFSPEAFGKIARAS